MFRANYAKNHLNGDDIDWLVPHQANLRIIDATAKRMNIGPEKVMVNIQIWQHNCRNNSSLFGRLGK